MEDKMNKYTQTYYMLNKNINESKEKIEKLNSEQIKAKEEKEIINEKIHKEKNKIYFLNCEKNQIITRKAIWITLPMTLLTLLMEIVLLNVGYNIIMHPLEGFWKAMAILGTLSIGGSLVIGTVLSMSLLTEKLKNKLHKKTLKTNDECKKLSKEIAKEYETLNILEEDYSKKVNEINIITEKILYEKELIRNYSQNLQNLKKEMIDIVLDTEEETLESSKVYTRVKKQNNI